MLAGRETWDSGGEAGAGSDSEGLNFLLQDCTLFIERQALVPARRGFFRLILPTPFALKLAVPLRA